ncbi:acyltransferase family protein [Pontibacter actiniarum]|nr:acyltransferase [Pontibacter actiniarum]
MSAVTRKAFKRVLFPQLRLSPISAGQKVEALDGIRGLAILAVLCYHCTSFFPLGWVGVDLFFVLSGFLLTNILLQRRQESGYFRSFYAKRALRILPLYALILWAACIFSVIYATELPHISYFFFLQNVSTALANAFPGNTHHLNHLWSIAVEEQFYLILPLAVYFLAARNYLLFLFALLVTALLSRSLLFWEGNLGYYVLLTSRMDALAFGSLAALLLQHHREVLNRWTLPLLYASAGILLVAVLTEGPGYDNPYLATAGYTLFALLFSCLLTVSLSTHPRNAVRQLFRTRTLRALGKYSFGLYIYHWPLFRLFTDPLKHHLKGYIPGQYLSLSVALLLAATTAIVTLLSYHLVEVRFLRLKKKVARKASGSADLEPTGSIKV